jgi:hypothetical protein
MTPISSLASILLLEIHHALRLLQLELFLVAGYNELSTSPPYSSCLQERKEWRVAASLSKSLG